MSNGALRKISLAAVLISVSATFFACSTSSPAIPTPDITTPVTRITAGRDDATKTAYNAENNRIEWSAEGETLSVLRWNGSAMTSARTDEAYELDGGTATFSVRLPAGEGRASYIYSAVYPAANYIDNGRGLDKLQIRLPEEQSPAAGSFDPNADLMVAQAFGHADANPEHLGLRFHRVAAIGRMTLKGIAAGEHILRAEIAATQPLAGICTVNLTEDALADGHAPGAHAISLTFADAPVATGEDAVWFTAVPCTLGTGDELTISVETDKATYTRSITSFDSGKPFRLTSANITSFGISGMTRTDRRVYTPLSGDEVLFAGDELIFVGSAYGTAYAAGSRFGMTGPDMEEIAVGADDAIRNPAENIMTAELVASATEGAFLLRTGGRYVNVSADGQRLETVAEAGAADRWTVTPDAIRQQAGICFIFCHSGTEQFFGAGQPDDADMQTPLIYRYSSNPATQKTPLAPPANLTATVHANVVTLVWDEVAGAAYYKVDCGGESRNTTLCTIDLTLDGGREYEIAVSAYPADVAQYRASEPAIVTATTAAGGDAFVRLTDANADALHEGSELIFVYNDGGRYVAAGREFSKDGPIPVPITVNSDDTITDVADDVMIATLRASGYAGFYLLQHMDGEYLWTNGWEAELKELGSADAWSITPERIMTCDTDYYFVYETEEVEGFCGSEYLGDGAYTPAIYFR